MFGYKVVVKRRVPKRYRPPELDQRLRVHRTVNEARLLQAALKAGVPVPVVFDVNLRDTTIVMEFVEGVLLRDLIAEGRWGVVREALRQAGRNIGLLHLDGIVHGDLTTSNMILSSDSRVFFIDFGLGAKSTELEDRGVDLHLMLRALESSHYDVASKAFEKAMEGYESAVGRELRLKVERKIAEIRSRARYVEERVRRL